MKHRFFFLGLAAVLFAACTVNEENQSTPAIETEEEFYATIEGAATKVYVDEDLKVLWHADDRVSIFNKYTFNQQYRFTGNTGANSGSFQKVPNEDFITGNALDYVYAVYPYQESTEISNQGVLTLNLPATQAYAEDSFGVGANTMVSCSEGNELLFKNLCGYIMLKLYGDGVAVSSISLKGNNNESLAGKATVTASIDGTPSLTFNASATKEITLTFDTPVALGTTAETATTFWLVVPPTTFEGGITLTVKTADGERFEKSTTGLLAISRNTRSTMTALKVIPKPSVRYLTFTSEGTTTLSLTNYNNAPVLYYSTDRTNWTAWDYSELSFSIEQPLYLCGDNPEGFSSGLDDAIQNSTFTSSGSNFGVSGDIMSLIDKDNDISVIPSSNCFYQLFFNCTGLTSAPGLPATTLADYCYRSMFSGCTSLASAPELPATTLAESCYFSMFSGCTSLTTAPELRATTLAKQCYRSMFYNCSGLTAAPKLPATELAPYCYRGMFYNCSSLTTAPELPATTLADYCYYEMFYGCTSLTTAPELPATTLASSCYEGMFYRCTGLTTAPELPATTLAMKCYSQMFYGCSQLNYVKCLATDISAANCVYRWLNNTASTGTFVKAAQMKDWPTGASGIPVGWTVLNEGILYPEAIDIGLSVKWASFNLGASKPEEYGDYFAWGETKTKDNYSWSTYKFGNSSEGPFSKYNISGSYGTGDYKTVLETGPNGDDVASKVLGGSWRMPTDAEWSELRNNCTWTWVENYNGSGINGRMVTSKTNGNNIFLPAAGYRDDTDLNVAGSYGYYWSSSLFTGLPGHALGVYFSRGGVIPYRVSRYYGFSVRPVSE